MKTAAALALVAFPLLASAQVEDTLFARSIEPVTVTASGVAATDTRACQRALDMGAATGRPIVFNATSKAFVIDDTLVLKPAEGQVHISGLRIYGFNKPDGSPTFWFTGSGTCLKMLGVKGCTFEGLRVQLRGKDGVGFWMASDAQFQSTSGSTFRTCSVEGNEPGQTAGFWIGPADDNREKGDASNDVSCTTFSRCMVSGGPDMQTGFHIWGRNTKSLEFDGCMVSATKGAAFLFDSQDFHKHCYSQGSVLMACDVSGVGTFLKSGANGNEVTVIGGRAELLTQPFAFWTTAQGGEGVIKVIGFKDASAKRPRTKVEGKQVVSISD